MQKKVYSIVCILFILSGSVQAQTDTILNRYKHYLLISVDPEGNITQLASGLNSKHQWDDINYSDTERSNWKPLIHLKRVRDMALVWSNPKSSFYHQDALWKAIDASLDNWLENKYKSSNWWHNEIGVPQYMRDIIILLKEDLSPQTFSQSLKVLAQYRIQNKAVGANLIWMADLGFHYAALTNNNELMQKCRDLMVKEIKITTGEGVQPDFSFHQHGKRLQMYHYGGAYLWDNVRLAWEVKGTTFSFPVEQIKVLNDFVLNGWQWMARGINTVPGTIDRAVSRVDALKSADIRKLIPYLIELSPDKSSQFMAIAAQQNRTGFLEGFRYYPYSDLAAYHTKHFSFFLKNMSARTLHPEYLNNENLKGNLMNSGDAYFIRDGKEYFNMMPVWDWQHLPGVTGFKNAVKIARKPFTGSVSDGKSGLSIMDYQLDGKASQEQISARKFWASNGGVVVFLIAGLTTKNIEQPVYTTLDQSRWRGDVVMNESANVLKAGNHNLTDVKWIYHEGLAYIPLVPARVNLRLGEAMGSWKEVNGSLSAETVIDKVFMPILDHGLKPSGLNSGYVVSYCKTPKKANDLTKHPVWNILRNDSNCQAVGFKDGTIMAAFFEAGKLVVKGKELSVDKPCLIQISKNSMYVSNPAHTEIDVQVKWDDKVFKLMLNADGSTLQTAY